MKGWASGAKGSLLGFDSLELFTFLSFVLESLAIVLIYAFFFFEDYSVLSVVYVKSSELFPTFLISQKFFCFCCSWDFLALKD